VAILGLTKFVAHLTQSHLNSTLRSPTRLRECTKKNIKRISNENRVLLFLRVADNKTTLTTWIKKHPALITKPKVTSK